MVKDELVEKMLKHIEHMPKELDAVSASGYALKMAEAAIETIRTFHSRALACHCECLGMNAENALAVCGNYTPPYNDAAYYQVMAKWGLMNEKGEPLI